MFEIPETDVVLMGNWDTGPEPTGRVVVRVQPAPSYPDLFRRSPIPYGYGDTPDTALAVANLRALGDLTGQTFADVGSGTGLLAILAAKQGATPTLFEEDADCRAYCLANCALNGITPDARARFPDTVGDGETFDLAIANVGNKIPEDVVAGLRAKAAAGFVVRWHIRDLTEEDPRRKYAQRWEAL